MQREQVDLVIQKREFRFYPPSVLKKDFNLKESVKKSILLLLDCFGYHLLFLLLIPMKLNQLLILFF